MDISGRTLLPMLQLLNTSQIVYNGHHTSISIDTIAGAKRPGIGNTFISHLYADPDIAVYYYSSILHRLRFHNMQIEESHVENGQASQNDATEDIRMFRYACSSILDDESFMIPSEGTELCVRMSKSLINLLSSPTQCTLRFTSWLIRELKGILEKCKRKNGLFNQEKLWSTFHQTTLSAGFKEKWETFLVSVGLAKEPLFYQHITDEIFNLLIKQSIEIPYKESQLEEYEEMLTFEEENAVRYVGGYVLRVLKKQILDSDVTKILDEFVEEDKENQDANTWVAAVDRGGLVVITEEAYQLFYAIETCVR